MGNVSHIWPEAFREDRDQLLVPFLFEMSKVAGISRRFQVWYRLPAARKDDVKASCDPFLLAALFAAMREGGILKVHGQVSPSLIQNLTEYQSAWTRCCPGRYRRVEIQAETESEGPPPRRSEAILAFSGGVDSCFSALRHTQGLCGRWRRRIGAGVCVHGFDVPLAETEKFGVALRNCREILTALGTDIIPVATNLRCMKQDWDDCFGAAVASCLMLFSGGYAEGLIASGYNYDNVVFPWGDTPATTVLLSSRTYRIVSDGAAIRRPDRVAEIAEWPQVVNHLRVCWQGRQGDGNCSRCEKCVRTMLCFRAVGAPIPEVFDPSHLDEDIGSLRISTPVIYREMKAVYDAAVQRGQTGGWVSKLGERLADSRHAMVPQPTAIKRKLKDFVKRQPLFWLFSSFINQRGGDS